MAYQCENCQRGMRIDWQAVRPMSRNISSVQAMQWGATGPYAVLRPFGQPNTQGARI